MHSDCVYLCNNCPPIIQSFLAYISSISKLFRIYLSIGWVMTSFQKPLVFCLANYCGFTKMRRILVSIVATFYLRSGSNNIIHGLIGSGRASQPLCAIFCRRFANYLLSFSSRHMVIATLIHEPILMECEGYEVDLDFVSSYEPNAYSTVTPPAYFDIPFPYDLRSSHHLSKS